MATFLACPGDRGGMAPTSIHGRRRSLCATKAARASQAGPSTSPTQTASILRRSRRPNCGSPAQDHQPGAVRQAASGVQDTMLNRIAGGKYASVQEMLNQPNQFSKITSRAPASLRRRRQHAPMPGDAFLSDWNRLAWRRDGRRAQLPQPRVLRSAQPRRLGQRGRGAEARYGVGNIAQYNGTAPGQLPVPPFNLNLGAGATGLQAIANQLAQNVAPELTKFTTTLASADGGLGQFSSSIASAAKSLLGDLFKSVSRGGFAEGSLISGDGTGTSRAMRDRASSFRRSGHDAEPTRTSPWSLTTSTSSAPARRPSTRALLDAIIQGEPPGSRPPLSLPSPGDRTIAGALSPRRPLLPHRPRPADRNPRLRVRCRQTCQGRTARRLLSDQDRSQGPLRR